MSVHESFLVQIIHDYQKLTHKSLAGGLFVLEARRNPVSPAVERGSRQQQKTIYQVHLLLHTERGMLLLQLLEEGLSYMHDSKPPDVHCLRRHVHVWTIALQQ